MIFAIIFALIYVLPSIIALIKNVKKFPILYILNLVTGWTVVGWIICLIASFSIKRRKSGANGGRLIAIAVPIVLFMGMMAYGEYLESTMTPEEKKARQEQIEKQKAESAARKAKRDYESFCNDSTTAFVASQQFVSNRLKDPNSAEYPSITDNKVAVTHSKGCRSVVIAYVDAKNGFGGVRRTPYVVIMKGDPVRKTWRSINVTISN